MGEAADRFAARLKDLPVVGIDTMVFIYHMEHHLRYAPLTEWLFAAVEAGTVRAVTGVVTLLEILVKPFQERREDVATDYRAILTSFPHLELVPVDGEAAYVAARLRAELGLQVPDALQLACAQLGGATAWITNDRTFRSTPGLPVVLLEDFAPAASEDQATS